MVKLFGKAIRINKASQDKTNTNDVGANLFVGNLDPEVDEKVGGVGVCCVCVSFLWAL
jgi:splicing factor 3B subunit 4